MAGRIAAAAQVDPSYSTGQGGVNVHSRLTHGAVP